MALPSLLLLLLTAVGPVGADEPDSQPPTNSEDKRDRVYYPGDTEHVKPLTRLYIDSASWLQQATRRNLSRTTAVTVLLLACC